MDLAATYRGAEIGRKREDPDFTVVLVGEVFKTSCHPLFPVAPAKKFPFALLPICNTPIIDCILENLAQNGVDEVNILLNSESVGPVQSHLQNNNNAYQKPWLESKDMRVKIVESARKIENLYDAVSVILEHNVVRQNTSFLFVPIDTIAFFTNLRDLFKEHVQRTRTIKGYKATLLCTSVKSTLENTLRDVLVRNIRERKARSSSAQSERDKSSFLRQIASLADVWPHAAPKCLPNHLTMFLLQKSTGVVRDMMRLEPQDENWDTMTMEFDPKERISLRTDLVPTNFLFCSDEALSLFEFHMKDQHVFLSYLLDKYELLNAIFGVQVITPLGGIVRPINSLKAYIQANIDVCCRRFFPLTCESGFAKKFVEYAVSSHCQTVYLHRKKAKVLSNACEPCVVVGEDVVVPPKAVVRGTVLGKGVQIGEGSVIVGCVLLDGAQVGRGCVLSYSLLGYGVVLGDGVEVSNTIIGRDCVIGAPFDDGASVACSTSSSNTSRFSDNNTNNGEHDNDEKIVGSGIVLHDQAIVKCKESDVRRGRSKGWRAERQKQHVRNIVPTREFFVRDPLSHLGDTLTDEDDDDDDDDDMMDMSTFKESVVGILDQALRDPSQIAVCVFQMKNVRLTFGRRNCDLCRIVTEHLLTHVLEQHSGQRDAPLLKAMEDLFAQWCRPFFLEMVTGDVEMQAVIEATCTAICDADCPLRMNGEELLQCLYRGCDGDLFRRRGYCIVSAESLIKFGDRMRRLERRRQSSDGSDDYYDEDEEDDYDDYDDEEEESEESEEDAREEGMLRVARTCLPYIDRVRAFLEREGAYE